MKIIPGLSLFCITLLLATFAQGAQVEYTAKMLRDPFIEEVKEISAKEMEEATALAEAQAETRAMEESIDTLAVEGIVHSIKNPVAIINGQIYRVGSHLGSGVVVKIEKEGVTISMSDKQFTLKQTLKKKKEAASAERKPDGEAMPLGNMNDSRSFQGGLRDGF